MAGASWQILSVKMAANAEAVYLYQRLLEPKWMEPEGFWSNPKILTIERQVIWTILYIWVQFLVSHGWRTWHLLNYII
jgi:hypothetical protein